MWTNAQYPGIMARCGKQGYQRTLDFNAHKGSQDGSWPTRLNKALPGLTKLWPQQVLNGTVIPHLRSCRATQLGDGSLVGHIVPFTCGNPEHLEQFAVIEWSLLWGSRRAIRLGPEQNEQLNRNSPRRVTAGELHGQPRLLTIRDRVRIGVSVRIRVRVNRFV